MLKSTHSPSEVDTSKPLIGRSENPAIVLSIAGSDPSGGAGIQADLKTFSALGVYGLTVITAITAQNTRGVLSVHPLPTEIVREQLHSVLEDFDISAIKIGMIASRETSTMLAEELRQIECPVILDPISHSTSGASFTEGEHLIPFLGSLIARSYLITPNIPEAEELTGIVVDSIEAMQLAGEMLLTMGPANVLVKGGHAPLTDSTELSDPTDVSDMTDILITPDGTVIYRFPRIGTNNLHGTGCTLSSAIAAMLAHGETLPDAVRVAKEYVNSAIEAAKNQVIGKGNGPLAHFYSTPVWRDSSRSRARELKTHATQMV